MNLLPATIKGTITAARGPRGPLVLRECTLWQELNWKHHLVGDYIRVDGSLPDHLRGRNLDDIADSEVVGARLTLMARVDGDVKPDDVIILEAGEARGGVQMLETSTEERRDYMSMRFVATTTEGDHPPPVPNDAKL